MEFETAKIVYSENRNVHFESDVILSAERVYATRHGSGKESVTLKELLDMFDWFYSLFHANLQYYKLNPNAVPPRKEKEGDAGWDLFYCGDEPITLLPGETRVVPTGLALVVDPPFVAILKEKSGLAVNGLDVHAGVVDSGYRGEVGVVLHNRKVSQAGVDPKKWISANTITISPYSKICQVMLVPVVVAKGIEELTELPSSDRGDGGFGHTGKF